MKKFNVIKTIQLIVMVLFLLVCLYLVLSDPSLFHQIANNPALKLTCALLWICYGIGIVFIFLDFSFVADYKRDYRELDYAVHSDPLSGLANRNRCDSIIERYADKPLPKGIGCVMLEFSNIRSLNARHGHSAGNDLIREFSTILKISSVSLCFVGRNGGNKFLAIFEESNREHIDSFLDRVARKTDRFNWEHPDRAIEYRYGIAYDEPQVRTITELVALSNNRIGK